MSVLWDKHFGYLAIQFMISVHTLLTLQTNECIWKLSYMR